MGHRGPVNAQYKPETIPRHMPTRRWARQGFEILADFPPMLLSHPRTRIRLPKQSRLILSRLSILASSILLAVWLGYVVFGTNRHTVIPGRVYRCSQPGADDVAEAVARHGIRTVVNLRGYGPDFDWYKE